MQLDGNVQTVQQGGGVAFGRIAVLFTGDAFQFAETHAVFIAHGGLGVELFALLERLPQSLVAHDYRIDDTVGVKGELILAQHAQFFRPRYGALLRLVLAGEQLHKGGFPRAVGPGETIAAARQERRRNIIEEDFCAEAHGDITYGNHGCNKRGRRSGRPEVDGMV